MNNEYNKAAEYYSNELAHRIEQAIPDVRLKDMGWLIVVFLANKSTFTLNVLSADKVDVSGEDCNERHLNLTGVPWQQAIDALAEANELTPATNEESTTGAVAGYGSAN